MQLHQMLAMLLSYWRVGEACRLESMAWFTGTRVGSYEIVDVLGDGGMGKVFRVRHMISDRTEAMKVLLAASSANQEASVNGRPWWTIFELSGVWVFAYRRNEFQKALVGRM